MWFNVIVFIHFCIPLSLGNIYLPTTTIDISKQPSVIDVFRVVAYGDADKEEADERYYNQQLTTPLNHLNKLPCLYLASFSQRPTPMQRMALGMVVGGESNILKSLEDNTFLIYARRSFAVSASISIDKLIWVGKYISKYKYTANLLKDLAKQAALTISIETVPVVTDVQLFSSNLLNSSIAVNIRKIKIMNRKIVVRLGSKIPKKNYEAVKFIAKYCEVVQIDSLQSQRESVVETDGGRIGRSSLLRGGY